MTRFVRVVHRGVGWAVIDDDTDQPIRGGFDSREEAERWARQWGYGGIDAEPLP